MIFIDTDIFVIDKLFQKDERHGVNRKFLDLDREAATSIYNLLELCGLASFSLTPTELTTLFQSFHRLYGLTVLYPRVLRPSVEDHLRYVVARIFEKLYLKMNYPDAEILLIAEEYDASQFITWNKKHFEGRTHLSISTPQEYLESL